VQARVAVDLKVTPEGTVTVTLRVVQTPAPRLPGLRGRLGFGASVGNRQVSSAVPSAVQAALTGAAWGAAQPAAAEPAKPRKPKKRVTWKSERELESVRWFIKEDPAVKVSLHAEHSRRSLWHSLPCMLHMGCMEFPLMQAY
jgi:hypothetical protein